MYEYEKERETLFSDEGQRRFLKVRDQIVDLLRRSGAVRMEEAIRGATGDTWSTMACVDRMVELGEIREVPQTNVAGQHRIFVATRV